MSNKIQKIGFIRNDNILDRIKNMFFFVFKYSFYFSKLYMKEDFYQYIW